MAVAADDRTDHTAEAVGLIGTAPEVIGSGRRMDECMSDYAQYPFQALATVGRDLVEIRDRIGSEAKNAFEVHGLAADQARISSSLDHFRSEWAASVQKLAENVGGFGDLSVQIGATSAQFDDDLARSLSPGGRGSHPAGRAR
jgi:hypothetical protein